MSACLRYLALNTLALVAILHSAGASSVVFVPYDGKGNKIQPAKSISLEAKSVWYKCGLKSWDTVSYVVDTRPATMEFTSYIVDKKNVERIGYKADGSKAYPSSAKAKCSRQGTHCSKKVGPVYFNYYERCLVVASDSTTTALNYLVSVDSKQEIKVFLLWGGVGLVALVIVLMVLNCIFSCIRKCFRSKKNYDRY